MSVDAPTSPPRSLTRRLLPLQVAVGLQGVILWVPVEKLFMSEIGFDAASVGAMAAAYAAVVPLFEVPSGILADRWSRRGVMAVASLALMASSLVGGLSNNVPMYVVSAMILGVYFAMNSGTVDAVVYDTVLEETGSNALYEARIGRVRLVESAAFVGSALAGGVLAGWTSARSTYFLSIPVVALAVLAFLRFNEPRLHRSTDPVPLRSHIALTFRTMTRQRAVLQIIILAALASLVSQAIFEFGPLWLVALAAPTVLYGPYWATLVSTLGAGGILAGKLRLDTRATAGALAVVATAAALVLTWSRSLATVIVAQAVLALLIVVAGIHVSRLLHDAIPSTIRAGVASGAGTLSWMVFLPFALMFGWLARDYGVHRPGWMLATSAMLVGGLLVASARRPPSVAVEAEPVAPAVLAPVPSVMACREFVELVTDILDGALSPDQEAACKEHVAGCVGCTEYLKQIRQTVEAMGSVDLENRAKLGLGTEETR